MAHRNETLDENMGWATLIKTILQTSGPVALIALLLVWYLMTSVNNQTRDVALAVKQNHEEIMSAKVAMNAFVSKQQEIDAVKIHQNDLILRIMREMCSNAAKGAGVSGKSCYE